MTTKVDPFVVPVPAKWANDPQIGPFVTYQSKFLHDLWTRTGAGNDLVELSARTDQPNEFSETNLFAGAVSYTGTVNLDGTVLRVNDTQVVGEQQPGITDVSPPSASDPDAPTAYSAHSPGAVTVTSDSASDLDTTAAALETLVNEVATYETAISALIADQAEIRTQLNEVIAAIRTHGLIST